MTLDQAYVHVLLPVEALTGYTPLHLCCSLSAHALRHVQRERTEVKHAAGSASPPAHLVVTPELLTVLRALLAQTTVSQKANMPYTLPSPQGEQEANQGEQGTNITQEATGESIDEQGANNYERVKAYLAGHPEAKVWEVAKALTISVSTANKWMIRMRSKCLQGEQREQDA